MPVIDAQHLSRRFGDLVAVRDVSMQVEHGEIFGVLGANGAGKSTTLRMLVGIVTPTSGSATVVGHDVVADPEAVKRRIGYMTQRFSLYDDLTVFENLEFYAGLYGVPRARKRARLAEVLELRGLDPRRRQLTGTLSGGWKQRLALACATIHEPPLLFLDEPTAGVDPVSRRSFWESIHDLSAQGTTIVVTTHYMDEAERCHRLAFIFRGSVLDTGTPQEVVDRRGLSIVEVHVGERTHDAARVLRADPRVDEVAPFGPRLRVATLDEDAETVTREVLGGVDGPGGLGIAVTDVRHVAPDVEDAFIAMVHEDARLHDEGAPPEPRA